MKPIFVDEILAECVANVSEALTPSLQLVDDSITGVHFFQGHPLEINQAMEKLSKGDKEDKASRYPAIWLLRDFPERKGRLPGIYSDAILRMFIVVRTNEFYSTDKRKAERFIPILYPVLEKFLDELEVCGAFETKGTDIFEYDQIDHYFWGRDGLFNNQKNFFTDWLDCIEIDNLKLSILNKNFQYA